MVKFRKIVAICEGYIIHMFCWALGNNFIFTEQLCFYKCAIFSQLYAARLITFSSYN